MNPSIGLSLARINQKHAVNPAPALRAAPNPNPTPAVEGTPQREERAEGGDSRLRLPFDPFRLIDVLWRRAWLWLLAGTMAAAGLFFAGRERFETLHSATAQIIKQETASSLRQSESGDPFKPRDLSIPTLMALMRSGPLLERAAAQSSLPVTEALLKAGLVIATERNTDIVRISTTSDVDAATALEMLRAYTNELLTFTLEMQRKDSLEMATFLEAQIERTEEELLRVHDELLAFGKRESLIDADKQLDAWLGELGNYSLKYESLRLDSETVDLRIREMENELGKVDSDGARLARARNELDQLLLRYTDAHPNVMEARDRVALMEQQIADGKVGASATQAPPQPGESEVAESLYLELVRLRSENKVLGEQLKKIYAVRDTLNERLEALPRKAMDYARIKSRQQELETSRNLLGSRLREARLHILNATGYYRLLSMARPQDVIVEPPTKKLAMVTVGGFVLGSGGVMALLIAWTLMDRRLVSPMDLSFATGAPVIGYLDAGARAEGADRDRRRTFQFWNRLQSHLTPTTGGGGFGVGVLESSNPGAAEALTDRLVIAASDRGQRVIAISTSSEDSVLAAELSLAEALGDPARALHLLRQHRMVRVRAQEDWTLDADLHALWKRALAVWTKVPGLVVLASIPNAQEPEAMLVAETLPNLVWAADSGVCGMGSVREVLRGYRDAGCRFVAGFMNHAPVLKPGGLARWALPLLAVSAFLPSLAMAAGVPLRLGPGDTVHIDMRGFEGHQRNEVAVAPDGSLTYLQVRQLPVSGLTIDQLRERLAGELRAYYKNARVIVTPGTLQSQKVYVLGKVVKKGAIVLDRPMTLVEVVAQAGGLETGLFQQNTVELADLGRSFVMRGDQKLPVDLEALFLRGDMSQNTLAQAGDYLYFPSANSNEIYVLGNVRMQGAQGLLAHTSVHSAIAQAGGFAEKAYTRKVLVIRGSLEAPEKFVVDMEALLAGREMGFRLEPKDIVYVADHPWARAEELLHFALRAFMQGAVSSWAGANIGPLIQQPILPSLR